MSDNAKDDFLGMSDEDFGEVLPSSLGSKSEKPVETEQSEEVEDKEVVEDADEKPADENAKSDDVDDDDKSDKPEDASKSEDEDLSDEELAKAKPPVGKKSDPKDEPEGKDKLPAKADDAKTEPEKVVTPKVVTSKEMSQDQLAGFYDQIMTPFKANGREIKLRTPEEAIRLMQMGAGYGKKLQDMQPHLKTLRMLENNNLLNADRLSYLIDLDKKNPDAIKKLVKDSGIDPLDFDKDDNTNYTPTNHSVSDAEVVFKQALEDLSSQEGGPETLQHINTTWDKESKDALWSQPELLEIIQSQRVNGLYDQITSEMNRMKTLGQIKANIPFLEAYQIAGNALAAANSLTLPGGEKEQAPTPKAAEASAQPNGKVLGTRIAVPKSKTSNNDKAKAAAPSASSSKAKAVINPLDMADDEFMKNFNGRL